MVLPLCRFSRIARTPEFIRIIKRRKWEKVLIFRTRLHFCVEIETAAMLVSLVSDHESERNGVGSRFLDVWSAGLHAVLPLCRPR